MFVRVVKWMFDYVAQTYLPEYNQHNFFSVSRNDANFDTHVEDVFKKRYKGFSKTKEHVVVGLTEDMLHVPTTRTREKMHQHTHTNVHRYRQYTTSHCTNEGNRIAQGGYNAYYAL